MSRFLDNFFRRNPTHEVDLTKRQPHRPAPMDKTGGMCADAETMLGIYYGTDPKTQFAAPLAFTPISVPVSLMGIPTPVSGDDATDAVIKAMLAAKADDIPIIHRTSMLMGTSWRFPRYDARGMSLVWESIPDQTITDTETDIVSGEILAIYTHELFKCTKGENQIGYAERKRKITRQRIDITWVQKGGNIALTDASSVNPFGFLPIPFGSDCGEGEWRGHSRLGRILRLMKSTHEIELKRDQILAQFSPKLIQGVKNIEAWLANNGMTDLCTVDPFADDFYVNIEGDESTHFEYLPADATTQHTAAINDNIKRQIIGSGIPELFWGPIATGNAASTDSQKNMAVAFVESLRNEMAKPWEQLINASLVIQGFVDMRKYKPVTIKWNLFDMVAPEIRAQILSSVAAGIGQIVNFASGTKEEMLYFWKMFFPDMPGDIKEFTTGIIETAKHKALATADAATQLDMENLD